VQDWLELLERAERERSLAADGRWDELAAAGAERTAFAATLGAPPAEARPVLERLAVIHGELLTLIAPARAEVIRRMSGLHRTAGAMRGYRPASGPRGGWVDSEG
jgi:hypothetical protein